MTTKERITETALSLFSEYGFKGTSVKQIADAVGIKDASLYKHFKSKQEIFDSIVVLIQNHMTGLSVLLGLPEGSESSSTVEKFYSTLDLEDLKHISKAALKFYLTDSYMSKFWRIAHMEQYQNEEIYNMFRRIFMEEAISYQTNIFEGLMKRGKFVEANPRAVAINFYAPIFLLLTKYENQPDKVEEALDILDEQIEEFVRIYRKE